jgi:hypothetical protein
MHSTIKTVAKVVEKINQSNDSSDKKGRHTTHKGKSGRVLIEKVGKQKNVWPVHLKYRQVFGEEDTVY